MKKNEALDVLHLYAECLRMLYEKAEVEFSSEEFEPFIEADVLYKAISGKETTRVKCPACGYIFFE